MMTTKRVHHDLNILAPCVLYPIALLNIAAGNFIDFSAHDEVWMRVWLVWVFFPYPAFLAYAVWRLWKSRKERKELKR